MSSRARLTMIANYLEALERPLRMKGIYTDCIINGCSPLAMEGEYDAHFGQYDKDINTPMPTLLNIRKNLSAMLSRDNKTFQQNYNLQPYARNVRYKNETDYIVVMNTSFGYDCFVKDEAVYSDTYPQNKFITGLKADGAFTKQSFPFEEHFHWKRFYDKFINAVLREYDGNRIILVKVNSARWYMESREICPFGDQSVKFRSRIEEIDDYFVEKTHCLCIDEQFNFIPVKKEVCAFTYASKSPVFYQRLVTDIESVIDGKTDEFKYSGSGYSNPLARLLDKKLSTDVLYDNKSILDEIENRSLSWKDIRNHCDALNKDFYRNIIRLNRFLDEKNDYTLSEHVIELLAGSQHPDSRVDFGLLELYVKYLKLNINDMIAVYMLYSKCENKNAFRNVVKNMVGNRDCLPIRATRKMREQNIQFLKKYPYIHSGLKDTKETESFYIRIENNVYLRMNLSKKDFIEKINIENGKFDPKKIIDNGYICAIENADALCSSYAFYIERAKRKESNHPVIIEFHDADQFSDSLNIYDYAELLTNENFVITLADKRVEVSDFKAICSLDFLLKKNTKICIIRSGLSDQICYYIFGKKLEEDKKYGLFRAKHNIYYDDTFYLYTNCFNGLEITKFAKPGGGGIQERLMSNLLSPKLKKQIEGNSKLPDILYKNGLDDLAMVSAEEKKLGEYKLCNKICSHIKSDENPYSLIRRKFDFHPCFYYTLIRPETFLLERKCDWNDYITFPALDERNRKIAEEMMLCDAVVIHMRLGDFVSLGYDVDNRFYIESFIKLFEISEYTNKKYYVFSDDIPYVKEHACEFGLDLLERNRTTYIDHNKGEDSFRDLQLMTYAKIMIASGSGVARTAFILSNRCEQIYLWKTEVLGLFEKICRKNKYDIGNYSRNYRLDYSKRKPKDSNK